MEKIGTSSLYVEKFRPQCFDDIIATEEIRNMGFGAGMGLPNIKKIQMFLILLLQSVLVQN